MWWCENTCVTAVIRIGDDVINRTGTESAMELIFKKTAATLFSIGILLAIVFCLQFPSNPNMFSISSWQKRWHIFQTQVRLHSWQPQSVTRFDQNSLSQRRRKSGERLRSEIFGKDMAEVFRRRVEQVEAACKRKHQGGIQEESRLNMGQFYKQLSIVMQCFSCSSRSQDYVEAKDSARKICEKKGLSEFCKCQCQPP